MINTKQLQSDKESTDRWWLSGKKQKQLNSCRTDSDHDEEKQGQWDKGEGSLGTDPNALINSPSLNYGEQQEAKCPNFDLKKKKWNRKSKHAVAQKKLQNLKEAATGFTDSRKDKT